MKAALLGLKCLMVFPIMLSMMVSPSASAGNVLSVTSSEPSLEGRLIYTDGIYQNWGVFYVQKVEMHPREFDFKSITFRTKPWLLDLRKLDLKTGNLGKCQSVSGINPVTISLSVLESFRGFHPGGQVSQNGRSGRSGKTVTLFENGMAVIRWDTSSEADLDLELLHVSELTP